MLQWLFGKRKTALPGNYKKFLDPEAVEIVHKLKQAGFESYLVGGVVRDVLAGIKPKDFDIATKATPQQVKHIIKRSFIIGKRFRIVVAKRRQSSEELRDGASPLFPVLLLRSPEKEYQITTFRREPVVLGGEVNENVFGEPREDALRRDFTVNGLFLDPQSGKILDYVEGVEDMRQRRLRVIGDPLLRLREDPIRILRAIRMMVKVDVKPDAATESALRQSIPTLGEAKKERVREELLKVLREGTAPRVFELYTHYGIWPHLSPEFSQLLNSRDNNQRAQSIWREISKTPWRSPQHAAPLFYLLFCVPLELLEEERIDQGRLLRLCEHFKVFRAESEEMLHIAHSLSRLRREPALLEHPHKVLADNPRWVSSQVQSFYVLKILADAGIHPYVEIWKNWRSHWERHVPFVKKFSEARFSAPSAAPRGPGGSAGPRRRRRGRRGGRRGPASV